MKANKTGAKGKKGTRYSFFGVSLVIAIAVVIAGGIYAFTNLIKPSETNSIPPAEEPIKTLLTIHLGLQTYDYTLKDLTALTSVTGQGGSISNTGVVIGPDNYTGVPINILLSTIPVLPANYTFHTITSGGYTQEYSIDAVKGHVTVFNKDGDEIGPGTLSMIVAYKENGVFLNTTTNGPLRIAFVYSTPVFTSSELWLSSLTEIEIM